MHVRVLFGVGAWLLGVAAATAGSLLAVSLLGHGIIDSPSQQLSVAAVNRALAGESAEPGESATATQTPRPRRAARAPQSPRPRISHSRPPATPALSRSPGSTSSSGTVLTSRGGTVVADCGSSGAYLVSWSPQQGYEVDNVVRGPAATAQVSFGSAAGSVTMVVTCQAGVPHATTYNHGHGDE